MLGVARRYAETTIHYLHHALADERSADSVLEHGQRCDTLAVRGSSKDDVAFNSRYAVAGDNNQPIVTA